METYGFVYLWYDTFRKMYYIGCRWGNIDDGYVCSSRRMRDAHRNRPHHFKRRILSYVYTNKQDLLDKEYQWLSMIQEQELGKKYYNLCNHHFSHWTTNQTRAKDVYEKISETKKAFWASNESSELREEVRAFHKARGTKPPSRKGKSSWNKGLTKETDSRVLNNSLAVSKPKRKHLKPKSEETKQMARDNMKRIWAERKRTTDAK